MKTRLSVLTLLCVLSLLGSGIGTAQGPRSGAALPVQSTDTGVYLLYLPLPEGVLPADVSPAAVPGHYLAALQRQWTETEGVLRALQERGLLREYTLLPEANAFRVTASEEALEVLRGLGTLSPASGSLQALERRAFERQFYEAIQAAQARTASLPRPPEPPEPPQAPPPPPPADLLIRLTSSDDALAAAEQSHGLIPYLEWLKQLGEVEEYEWLPDLGAFRVRARGDLSALQQRPEVAAIVPYDGRALQEARPAPTRLSLQALPQSESTGIQVYTPTTPTVSTQLYDYWVSLSSDTSATTVLTLTNSAGALKNDPAGTWFYGWWSGGGRYYAYAYLYDASGRPARMYPGDILYVHQQGYEPVRVDIPDLTAFVDREADTVSGRARRTSPAPTRIALRPWRLRRTA